MPVFRLTSAVLTGGFYFRPEDWGCPGTLGKLFCKTLLPQTVSEAANSFLLASSSSQVCRRGISGLASCAPSIWTNQKPYSRIFMMPLQKEISFSFFQSWQEQSSACLIQFSASFLCLPAKDRARVICVVLGGRQLWSAARHSQQCCDTVLAPQQFGIFPQACRALRSYRGSWPGRGSCWEQPPAVSVTWASPPCFCHECS